MSKKTVAKCETCLHWKRPPASGNYSECLLTAPDAHETLTYQVVYTVNGTDDSWIPIDINKDLTAILHTRKDFGCVQYDSRQ